MHKRIANQHYQYTNLSVESNSKVEWREWAKEQRKRLPTEDLSQQICQVLIQWPIFQDAKHILTYRAFDSEFDLSPLESLSTANFYITRTWLKSKKLTVHSTNISMEKHPFGYQQPQFTAPQINPQIIDIALVPGLCFDHKGTRLGYGMGLYDRFLSNLDSKTYLVGVTAKALLLETLPKNKFDVPMTHLVNEAFIKQIIQSPTGTTS